MHRKRITQFQVTMPSIGKDAMKDFGIPYAKVKRERDALLYALMRLRDEIKLEKLNIRKDFYLINAHAGASKAIHEATK